jgi:hypothetical protein
MGSTNGARNEARIGGEALFGPHIDERGAMWHADQTPKLFRRDAV